MTRRFSISLPDDVAAELDQVDNASAYVADAIRMRRRRLILPVLAHAMVMWTGYDQLTGVADPGFKPLLATLWLLVTATRSAWDLMVEVGEVK